VKDSMVDRFQGCLVGLAVGDALGAPVEFCERHRFTPLTDMVSGGKFQMRRGEWTDDTAMALCLADSLLACGGFDAKDQMDRYWRWGSEGYNSTRPHAFGIGKTVAGALRRYQRTGDPWCGSEDPWTSGNGSLMRLSPIPMFYAHDLAAARQFATLSSRTTHGSGACLDACRHFATLLVRALNGENSKEQLLLSDRAGDWLVEMQPIVLGDFRTKPIEEINGSGYVIESLEAALWCFWHTNSFQEAVLMAANLGNDSDTTAAICGQIAGAYYGLSAIPSAWRDCLFEYDRICRIALHLAISQNQQN
jgi:ADP-ribosyl-[dinitrogen reductase] hydrolase